MKTVSAAREILWWAERMPAAVRRPAVKAFPEEGRGRTPLRAQSVIPRRPSALIVRQCAVCTIPIISVRQSTWTLRDAAPADVGRRSVQPLRESSRDKCQTKPGKFLLTESGKCDTLFECVRNTVQAEYPLSPYDDWVSKRSDNSDRRVRAALPEQCRITGRS